MEKRYLVILGLCLVLGSSKAQKALDAPELNCYNKWSVKFEERGAEEVKDGTYTDVIITIRQGSRADCYSGKAEVIEGKLVRFFTEKVDGSLEEVKKSWKGDTKKSVSIYNGISSTMVTIHNELINVIWPNKLKPKKAALKRAPDPTDD